MTTYKTPEQIARELAEEAYGLGPVEDGIRSGWFENGIVLHLMTQAIEADRAQRPAFFEEHAKEVDPGSLYLRVGIADGKGPNGEEIDFSMTVGGASFILDVKRSDGTRRKQTISTVDLATAWADHIRGGDPS